MRRIDRPHHTNVRLPVLEATYDDVRQSFFVRLHSERARLADLTSVLESAQVDPVSAFIALETFAHRLRGAAAVFDFPALCDAAKALEFAAGKAVSAVAPADEPGVQNAIRLLAVRLTSLNEGPPLSAL